MNQLVTLMKPYVTAATGTAAIVTTINFANIQKQQPADRIEVAQLVALSVVKGYIYGAFVPLSWIGIGVSLFDTQHFRNHWIPGSVYGPKKFQVTMDVVLHKGLKKDPNSR